MKNIFKFMTAMYTAKSGTSSKRIYASFIIVVIAGGIFTPHAELCINWLGSIAIACIAGTVSDNFNFTKKNNNDIK